MNLNLLSVFASWFKICSLFSVALKPDGFIAEQHFQCIYKSVLIVVNDLGFLVESVLFEAVGKAIWGGYTNLPTSQMIRIVAPALAAIKALWCGGPGAFFPSSMITSSGVEKLYEKRKLRGNSEEEGALHPFPALWQMTSSWGRLENHKEWLRGRPPRTCSCFMFLLPPPAPSCGPRGKHSFHETSTGNSTEDTYFPSPLVEVDFGDKKRIAFYVASMETWERPGFPSLPIMRDTKI